MSKDLAEIRRREQELLNLNEQLEKKQQGLMSSLQSNTKLLFQR